MTKRRKKMTKRRKRRREGGEGRGGGKEGKKERRSVAEYSSASPFPEGTTRRRPSAWTNPLSVAHAGS